MNLIHVKKTKSTAGYQKCRKLNLCYFNAQSACNKTHTIVDYISDHNIDLCCITESWIQDGDSVTQEELKPNGFDLRNFPRNNRTGGGIAIIFKESIKPKLVSAFERKSFECTEWIIPMESLSEPVRLVIVYRPPYSPVYPVPVSTFMQEFSEYLETVMLVNGSLMILGDFNIHVEDAKSSEGRNLLNLFASCGLTQHIVGPTHKDGGILDLLLTRDSDSLLLDQPIIDFRISDHDTILFKLDIPKPPRVVKEISYRQD